MALSDVSNILWRERQLLELLVFKLEEEQLVLAAGRSRWLVYATREVENVLGEIKRIELERAVDRGAGVPVPRRVAGLARLLQVCAGELRLERRAAAHGGL